MISRLQAVPFTPDRKAAVIELVIAIQRDEFGLKLTAEEQPDLMDIPGFCQRGRGNFWVALDGDRVVGTIALVDIGGGRAALRKMFVHPGYRGREAGTAALLLETLLAWARDRGLSEVLLGTTAAYHAAHRFYEKNGFLEISPGELPPEFPRFRLDTRFYRMALK